MGFLLYLFDATVYFVHLLFFSFLRLCPAHDPTRITPLSALLIRDHLPVMRFSDVGASIETCAVCLCEFEGWEVVRWLENCSHLFHRGCLDRWIDLDHRTCPLCRAHLLRDDLVSEFNDRRRLSVADQYYYSDDDR